MPVIDELQALEILDSRGRPTVLAYCRIDGAAFARASVPSGASTGTAEALELRDGDPRRYGGLGCRRAVAHINGELNGLFGGRRIESQATLDTLLIEADGTPDKSRLGANALLAVSLAFARAVAASRREPLWRYFADLLPVSPAALPRLAINLFSGGKHAGQQVPIQDVLIVPLNADTIDRTLSVAWDVYQAAAALAQARYGMRLLRADEGGQAPPFATVEDMLQAAIESIESAGYRAGEDVALALDVAATHFYVDGRYELGDERLTSSEMIARLRGWVESMPIVSVEDGLADTDWDHWPALRDAIADRALVVGDDLLCTNPGRIRRARQERCCTALLLKVNQIGTLTEAAEARRLATESGWATMISVRSGETEDDWAADLAVGWQGDQFKNGSITQSERLAKYNRLLEIEATTQMPVAPWPALPHRPQPAALKIGGA
jgi:enolase